jgi:hypothetical protein
MLLVGYRNSNFFIRFLSYYSMSFLLFHISVAQTCSVRYIYFSESNRFKKKNNCFQQSYSSSSNPTAALSVLFFKKTLKNSMLVIVKLLKFERVRYNYSTLSIKRLGKTFAAPIHLQKLLNR